MKTIIQRAARLGLRHESGRYTGNPFWRLTGQKTVLIGAESVGEALEWAAGACDKSKRGQFLALATLADTISTEQH